MEVAMSTWADPQKDGRRPPAHRAMLYMSAPSTVSIPAGTTWRKLTMFDRAGMERGMVASTATDSIAIKRRGQFEATFQRTYSVTVSDVLWHIAILLNGLEIPGDTIQRTTKTNNEIQAGCSVVMFDAMAGDVLTVAAYHNQVSAVNLTYQNAALSIKSID